MCEGVIRVDVMAFLFFGGGCEEILRHHNMGDHVVLSVDSRPDSK